MAFRANKIMPNGSGVVNSLDFSRADRVLFDFDSRQVVQVVPGQIQFWTKF